MTDMRLDSELDFDSSSDKFDAIIGNDYVVDELTGRGLSIEYTGKYHTCHQLLRKLLVAFGMLQLQLYCSRCSR